MLLDANLLLYARDSSSPKHDAASAWLTERLNGQIRVGIPWQSAVAFIRIATHPRAYERPLSPTAAREQLDAWLEAPTSWVPTPTDRHWQILAGLIEEHDLRGNLISDAHLAALAIEHGLELCSADTDFARFDDLRWSNPLA
ncbi:MAG: type II toxin-antitoxin system VapC family toxin [Actinomycetota bacterium]|nr:type II toxin-antitoxin system VapC family toxin [Actinomycetota bacterium]